MALDYLNISLSVIIFIFYLAIFFLLIEIKKKLSKDAGRAFIYFMIAIFSLVLRRLHEIFVEVEILSPIKNSAGVAALIFVIFFFLGLNSFYRALKKAGTSKWHEHFSYKKFIGRI